MKQLFSFTLLAILFLPLSAFAEIKTVTHTLKQSFGGSQSPDDARTAGIARAKREALEQFGTYIESTTVVKDAQVDSDDILALTAGVTKAEVIMQKNYTDGDGFGLEITVKVELDTAVLEKSLKRLLEDRNHLKDLKAAREREKKLLARIVELEKENQEKGKSQQKSEKLRQEFKAASQGLTAVDWFDKAMVLWDGKYYTNSEKALEYLNQAIRLVPNFSAGYNIRGAAYSELNQWSRAIADYNQAISLDPNFTIAYNGRAIAYFNLDQFGRAIEDFGQVIRLDPTDAGAYQSRGSSYGGLKQFDLAIADYAQAIRLEPNDARNFGLRGVVYLLTNNTQEGCVDLNRACSLGECGGYEMARQKKLCR